MKLTKFIILSLIFLIVWTEGVMLYASFEKVNALEEIITAYQKKDCLCKDNQGLLYQTAKDSTIDRDDAELYFKWYGVWGEKTSFLADTHREDYFNFYKKNK